MLVDLSTSNFRRRIAIRRMMCYHRISEHILIIWG